MMSRRMIIGLGAAFLVSGGALAFGAVFPGFDGARPRAGAGVGAGVGAISIAPRAPATGPAAPGEPALSGNPLWGIPLKELAATRERPLFSPTRRPPPSAAPVYTIAAASKPAAPERPQLKLIGTIAGEREGFGIFLDQASNRPIRLRTGQSHDGWTLREVRPRETVFGRNDDTVVLALPVATVAARAGPPAAAQIAAQPGLRRPRR